MDERIYVLLAILAILGLLGSWIARGSNDRERIRRNIQSRGGKVLSIQSPSAIAALAHHASGRSYLVEYLDRDGKHHRARCHTTGWIGVFFADDQVVDRAAVGEVTETMEEENRRLQEEMKELKRKLGDKGSDAIKEP